MKKLILVVILFQIALFKAPKESGKNLSKRNIIKEEQDASSKKGMKVSRYSKKNKAVYSL